MDDRQLNATLNKLNKTMEGVSRVLDSISSKEREEKYNKEHSENPNSSSDKGVNKAKKTFSKNMKGAGMDMLKLQQATNRLAKEATKGADEISDSSEKLGGNLKQAWRSMSKSLNETFTESGRRNKKLNDGIDDISKSLSGNSKKFTDSIREQMKSFKGDYESGTKKFLEKSAEVNNLFVQLANDMEKYAKAGKMTETQLLKFDGALKMLIDSGIDVNDEFELAGMNLNEFMEKLGKNNGNLEEMSDEIIKFQDTVVNSGNKYAQSVGSFVQKVEDSGQSFQKKMSEMSDKMATQLRDGLKGVFGEAAGSLLGEAPGLMQTGATDTRYTLDRPYAIGYGVSLAELADVSARNADMLRHFGDNVSSMDVLRSGAYEGVHNNVRSVIGLTGKENLNFVGNAMQSLVNTGIKPTEEAMASFTKSAREFAGLSDTIPQEVGEMFSELTENSAYRSFLMSRRKEERTLSTLNKEFKALSGTVYGTSEEFKKAQLRLAQRSQDPAVQRKVQSAYGARLGSILGMTAQDIAIMKKGAANPKALEGEERTRYFDAMQRYNIAAEQEYTSAQQSGNTQRQTLLEVLSRGLGMDWMIHDVKARSELESGISDARGRRADAVVAQANEGFGVLAESMNALNETMKGWANTFIGKSVSAVITALGAGGSIGLGALLGNNKTRGKIFKGAMKPFKWLVKSIALLGGAVGLGSMAGAKVQTPKGSGAKTPYGHTSGASKGSQKAPWWKRATKGAGKWLKRSPYLAAGFGAVDEVQNEGFGINTVRKGLAKGVVGGFTGTADLVASLFGFDTNLKGVSDKYVGRGMEQYFAGERAVGSGAKSVWDFLTYDKKMAEYATNSTTATNPRNPNTKITNDVNNAYGDSSRSQKSSLKMEPSEDIKRFNEENINLLSQINDKLGKVVIVNEDGNVIIKENYDDQKKREEKNKKEAQISNRITQKLVESPLK